MPQYKLHYFDIKGLAEPIRLCFVHAGVPFEEVRIKFDEWPQYKDKMPFGQVPLLEVDGKKMTQSTAILRYIAKKHGLDAEDEWDRAIVDELGTSWLDVFGHFTPAFKENDKDIKKQKTLQAIEDFAKPRMKIFNERLGESKTGFLVGNKVTWADFITYNFLVMFTQFLKVSIEPYPNLVKFMKKIEDLPKVKEWQASTDQVPFTVFPSPVE